MRTSFSRASSRRLAPLPGGLSRTYNDSGSACGARGRDMDPWLLWFFGLAVVFVGVAVALCWRPLRAFGQEMHLERARELFKLQRERLEAKSFTAAAASGGPRGLRWKECQWGPEVEFARERSTREIVALVSVTVQFEAVEGGDMEGVPAVEHLKSA